MKERVLLQLILNCKNYPISAKFAEDFFNIDKSRGDDIDYFSEGNVLDCIGTLDNRFGEQSQDIGLYIMVKNNLKIEINIFSQTENKPNLIDQYVQVMTGNDKFCAKVDENNCWEFKLKNLNFKDYELICNRVVDFRKNN
jgi:hypothetical protein